MRPLPLHLVLQRRRQRKLSQQHTFAVYGARFAWGIAFLAVMLASAAVLIGARLYAGLTSDLPALAVIPTLLNGDDGLLLQPTRLYDRSGRHLLLTLQDNGANRKYLVVDPQKPNHLSPFLLEAAIQATQPDFWQSSGIAWQRLLDPEALTVAEKMVDRLVLTQEPPGLRRTLRMRLLAGQLVSRYGRAQVLEWYLNSAFFGRLAYGAESAARLYFEKSAAEVDLGEAALLAATLRAPALNPLDAPQAALENQRALLEEIRQKGAIDADQAQAALNGTITLRAESPESETIYATFTRLVLDQLYRRFGRARVELGGLQVITSLDLTLQAQVTCTLRAQLARGAGRPISTGDCEAARFLPALPAALPSGEALEGSAAVIDLATGQVLALTGDSSLYRESIAQPEHSPGTLLSPFLAVTAFSRGFSPASLVWDIPGLLTPALDTAAHPGGQYIGPTSLRRALANDLLSPLQQLLVQIGAANAWQLAAPLGLPPLAQTADPGGLLFEGGSVKLLEAAQAYSALANLGELRGQRITPTAPIEPASVLQVRDDQGRRLVDLSDSASQAVLSPALAYLVHNVLSDEPARWPSLGYPNLLEIGRPAGAKIGVTTDQRQAWTVGYTPQRLVVSWMGLPESAGGETGLDARLSAGVWHALMQYIHQELPVEAWSVPSGVSKMDVCSPSGLLPTQACPNIVSDVFLSGNEPTGADTLYRTFQINSESGLLATVFTPPELVEERTFLVLPKEAQSWGKLAGLPLPPENYDRIQSPPTVLGAAILSPQPYAVVRGQVTLNGSAGGDGFVYYQVQVGQGLNPETWLPLGERQSSAVTNGQLAVWDTGESNGLYVLRLQVVYQDQRLETAILQVTVDNTPPSVRVITPFNDQRIASSSSAFPFQVAAEDAVGIRQVDFILDDLTMGSRSAAPYTLVWNARAGIHRLRVIATDLAGNTAQSEVQFIVTGNGG